MATKISGMTAITAGAYDDTALSERVNNAGATRKATVAQDRVALLVASCITAGMIAAGTIVNADINAAAAIVDTKLATISTAGKVSNSATTATSANTASAIVARDASGNFTAGTITASITGHASLDLALTGGTLTGDLNVGGGGGSSGSKTLAVQCESVNGAIAGMRVGRGAGPVKYLDMRWDATTDTGLMTVTGTTVLTFTSTSMALSSGVVLQLGNAAAVGAALVSTHTVTVKDSTGTTYRLMALV